ncbi:hypothetical protein TBLA_0A07740 [Henningerozyma blattae CBS 6284]|uniref:1,3-beta-glucanosyltransferase n=1 Tax=Henningerozyma blattae (strain ATCC 34711 / CBS 6284 / DSM 70876 / NBRC 10599 / NRRL Y-10934 / UCD 77-7) TaxID=1071380 RepID=I2GWR1_HENB6|nr:hypothetical protein TBLA_0A07740 [Tetrapisispora blattae CBS 6284]CCH58563.1 hypothetical protein TBLA_0A07740 [Tetrapisispora blattae CBS 6284]
MKSNIIKQFLFLLLLPSKLWAAIHPIDVVGKYFVDSITKERFYIKGVDYQPGGSSEELSKSDPLSDPEKCARDIVLFQELGINTIRIYSINPDLDHDKCMTMLAAAGIYLLLDVNSPVQGQHLNRYEPWSTYTMSYVQHIFKVVEKFSYYNNTLGFFAGNEVVNDMKSAQFSPKYIKVIIGDLKKYIEKHSPRSIPVGYSAADDLNYRASLASYLECAEEKGDTYNSVDFYGVNSYQWCGTQTMESSGYDKLIRTYSSYTKPIIFSEFGCNQVLPRQFDEVKALFSKPMTPTFSGGLVYEFTQESNNYGLVSLDSEGNAHILGDFEKLKNTYKEIPPLRSKEMSKFIVADETLNVTSKQAFFNKHQLPICKNRYDNLNIEGTAIRSVASPIIFKGNHGLRGYYVTLEDKDLQCEYEIYDINGKARSKESKRIKVVNDLKSEKQETIVRSSGVEAASLENSSPKRNFGSQILRLGMLCMLIFFSMMFLT